MKTKIDTISIIVAGTRLDLTPIQAKELYQVLGELFPAPTPVWPNTIVVERERTWPVYPTWHRDIICYSGNSGTFLLQANQ